MAEEPKQQNEDRLATRQTGGIGGFLNKKADQRIDQFVERHARQEDGTLNEPLAQRIRWEVSRRAETGKQLDIYEPFRWTVIRGMMGIVGAGIAKLITDRLTGKGKKIGFGVEIGIIVTTAVSTIIDLTRLYPRWLAGLEGGKNTALMLHHKFDAPALHAHGPALQPSPESAQIPEPAKDAALQGISKKPAIQPISLLQRAEQDKTTKLPSL